MLKPRIFPRLFSFFPLTRKKHVGGVPQGAFGAPLPLYCKPYLLSFRQWFDHSEGRAQEPWRPLKIHGAMLFRMALVDSISMASRGGLVP